MAVDGTTNKKQLLYFIGGNPNTVSAFDLIKKDFQWDHIDINQFPSMQYSYLDQVFDWILSDIKDYERVIFVAYSYGSYLLTKLLENHQINKDIRCIFIAPSWQSLEGVSSIARALLGSPFFGKRLLNKIATNKPKEFIENIFSPEKAENYDIAPLNNELRSSSLWKQAIKSKQLQFTEPLGNKLKSKLKKAIALEGQKDKVSCWEVQNKIAKSLIPNLEIINIENQGNALPWTQKDLIAKSIHRILEE